jgi:hypothetical protein
MASSSRIDLPGATVLEGAIGQMKAILRGSEDNAIATFNASHRSIKEGIKRAVELEQALSEPRLRDLDRAREALKAAWPFLREESDVPEDLRSKATMLQDLLARETFYRELPTIEQYASAIEAEYERRYDEALQARIAGFGDAPAPRSLAAGVFAGHRTAITHQLPSTVKAGYLAQLGGNGHRRDICDAAQCL